MAGAQNYHSESLSSAEILRVKQDRTFLANKLPKLLHFWMVHHDLILLLMLTTSNMSVHLSQVQGFESSTLFELVQHEST